MNASKTNGAVGLLLALLLLVSPSCSTGGNGDVLTPEARGVLTVALHDDASETLREATVTFASVRAHHVGGDWVELDGTFPITVDLVALLDGDTVALASDSLPPGDYDRVELTITAVHVVTEDGTAVDLPLHVTAIVPIHFTVIGGKETVITLVLRETSLETHGTAIVFQPEIEADAVEIRGGAP